MELVLVYGSLREGMHNHPLLQDSRMIGKYRLELPFEMYSLGGFPALTNTEELNPIIGEVYEVDQPTFLRLDRLEGYPRFYDRIQVDTPAGQAWVYFIHERDFTDRVDSGDWKEYYYGKHQQGETALSA